VDEENQRSSPVASVPLSVIPEINILRPSKRQRVKSALFRGWNILFPTLHHFTQKSALGMVAALFAVPAVFCLTITLPVVVTPRGDNEDVEEPKPVEVPEANIPQLGTLIEFGEDEERPLLTDEVKEELKALDFNKWLMAVQCVFGPLFCVSVLFSTFWYNFRVSLR
jgi:sodium/potassium/calcium exchanger 6